MDKNNYFMYGTWWHSRQCRKVLIGLFYLQWFDNILKSTTLYISLIMMFLNNKIEWLIQGHDQENVDICIYFHMIYFFFFEITLYILFTFSLSLSVWLYLIQKIKKKLFYPTTFSQWNYDQNEILKSKKVNLENIATKWLILIVIRKQRKVIKAKQKSDNNMLYVHKL